MSFRQSYGARARVYASLLLFSLSLFFINILSQRKHHHNILPSSFHCKTIRTKCSRTLACLYIHLVSDIACWWKKQPKCGTAAVAIKEPLWKQHKKRAMAMGKRKKKNLNVNIKTIEHTQTQNKTFAYISRMPFIICQGFIKCLCVNQICCHFLCVYAIQIFCIAVAQRELHWLYFRQFTIVDVCVMVTEMQNKKKIFMDAKIFAHFWLNWFECGFVTFASKVFCLFSFVESLCICTFFTCRTNGDNK